MKITPINFASYLEPELIAFWQEQTMDEENGTVKMQRMHNLKLKETNLAVSLVIPQKDSEVLCNIQLVEIPQQENNAAINAHLHLKGVNESTPILMIFKKEEDTTLWVEKIISELGTILRNRPATESED